MGNAGEKHPTPAGRECNVPLLSSKRIRERVSRKIIWKVCLTLEHAFIFEKKNLGDPPRQHRPLPSMAGIPATHPWHEGLLLGCLGLWRGQCDPDRAAGQPGMLAQGCWHSDTGTSDAGTVMLVQSCSWTRRQSENEMAGTDWQQGKGTARGSGTEGAPGPRFSPQVQGASRSCWEGNLLRSRRPRASQAVNVGLIRGGFERMVVDKEEKYLAFLSHHNKPRCLDGGSPLPTGMESHSRSPGQLGRGPFPHTYEMPAPPNTAPWPSPGTHGATHGATSVTHVPSGDAAHDSHSRGDTAWSSVGNLLGKVKLQIWCWCRSLVQLGAAPCMPALLLSSSSSSSSHCAFACPGSVPPAGPAAFGGMWHPQERSGDLP